MVFSDNETLGAGTIQHEQATRTCAAEVRVGPCSRASTGGWSEGRPIGVDGRRGFLCEMLPQQASNNCELTGAALTNEKQFCLVNWPLWLKIEDQLDVRDSYTDVARQ